MRNNRQDLYLRFFNRNLSKIKSPGAGKTLFVIGTVFYWTSLYIYSPIFTPYAKNFSESLGIVGLVIAAYGFTQFLFRFPIGIWSDKIGRRKPFVLSGFGLVFVSCIGLALSPNAWFLLFFRAVAGIAASMWVAFSIFYSGYFRDDQVGRAMSFITFCVGLGQCLGTAGGKIADAYGRTSTFYVGAFLSVIGLLFALPISERVKQDRVSASFQSLLSVASRKLLVLVSIITALSQFGVFTTAFGFLTQYAEQLHATDSEKGLLMFIITASQTLSMLLTGTLVAPRIGYKATVGIAYIGITTATFLTPFIQNLHVLFLVQGTGALLRGLAYPVMMGLAVQGVRPEEKAAAMGFFQAVYAIGMFSGPAISGFIGDIIELRGVFFGAAIIYSIAAALSISMLPNRIEKKEAGKYQPQRSIS